MASEVTLGNLSFTGAIKEGAPHFKLPDAIWRFLGVQLCHPVMIEELTAAHCVAEVNHPVVIVVDVTHRGSSAAFSHHGVSLAKEGFTDDRYRQSCLASLYRCPKSCSTRADNDDVVGVLL